MDAKPDKKSADIEAMGDYWSQVSTILGGVSTMRAAGKTYLPKLPQEHEDDYKFRLANVKFTNIFRDIVENLSVKPFTEEVRLIDDKSSERIKTLAEDIDSKGNSLHVFAQTCFFNGISYAVDWILVDYTKGIPPQATVAMERQLGARPYWVHIPAQRMLAVYSDMIGGKEVFTHVRFREDVVERDGYAEVVKKRIREFNREPDGTVTWQLLEEQKNDKGETVWIRIDGGVVTIGVISLVPFVTGRRMGSSWQLIPPMRDAADLQIELYQQESGLKNVKTLAGFPMLSGNGVAPELDEKNEPKPLRIGPMAVLYAPPQQQGSPGSWDIIEPSGESMRFLAEDIEKTKQDLRELGRQPLTAQTGNLTVVTTAFAAQKGNSAIQAWALNLKDALEQAWVYTTMWLKEEPKVEVHIDTDFDLSLNDEKGPDSLIKMRAAGDISRETLWREMQRRSVLSPEFDAEEEDERLISEMPGDPADPESGEATGATLPQ